MVYVLKIKQTGSPPSSPVFEYRLFNTDTKTQTIITGNESDIKTIKKFFKFKFIGRIRSKKMEYYEIVDKTIFLSL